MNTYFAARLKTYLTTADAQNDVRTRHSCNVLRIRQQGSHEFAEANPTVLGGTLLVRSDILSLSVVLLACLGNKYKCKSFARLATHEATFPRASSITLSVYLKDLLVSLFLA